MEGEEILPGIERHGIDECGFTLEGGWLPNDESGLLAKSGGGEILLPIEARSVLGEVGLLPGIVGVVNVFAIGEADVDGGNCLLEGDDTRGASIRIAVAGELEHGGDVLLIFRLKILHVRSFREVVVAIGQLKSALKEVGRVVIGIVEVRRDPESENIVGVIVGVVEGVDIGAKSFAE